VVRYGGAKLLVAHQAREIDLPALVIEENLAANCGWHQIRRVG
jgi:hypothetical protein